MQGAAAIGSQTSIKPGDVIAGKYEVVRIIGEGGMGVVVEAVHRALDQRVAIKFLRREATAHPEAVTRFLREAKAAAQMRTEHVARVYDVSTLDAGDPYFVMEYLEGRDLDTAIQEDGPLEIGTAIDYALQVSEALAEAHAAGIVHRDLKPANLFLANRTDGTTIAKLLDFGISKLMPKGTPEELSMTKTRAVMGSPLYMAPEQMRSMRRVDHRADIWSLGVLLHEMLTGETPFVGETLPEVCASIAADEPIRLSEKRPETPAELEEVVLRCLEKEPEDRYEDVAQFAQALAPFAPPDAKASIVRIGRLLRGSLTPSMPIAPRVSLSPGDPTSYFEPADQRRSGVAPKTRRRVAIKGANAAAGARAAAAAAETAVHAPSRSVWLRTPTVLGTCLVVAAFAAGFFLAARSHRAARPPQAPVAVAAVAAVAPVRQAPQAQPASPPPAATTAAPALELEIVETPAAPAAAATARGSGRATTTKPARSDAKTSAKKADATSAPAGSAAPEPAGTAAFGAGRD